MKYLLPFVRNLSMSWSVCLIGEPKNIVKALREESSSGKFSGQSKADYDEALPLLINLVEMNFTEPKKPPIRLKLSASGSGEYSAMVGSKESPKRLARRCSVVLEPMYERFV